MSTTDLGVADSAEHLRRLLRVTDVALAHLSPDDLLDELLIRVREVLGADTAAVLLLDERTDELVATAAKGMRRGLFCRAVIVASDLHRGCALRRHDEDAVDGELGDLDDERSVLVLGRYLAFPVEIE